MIRILMITVFLLFSGLLQPVHAAWREIRSDNFVIYTDVGEKKSRALIQDLEAFRYYLGLITNRPAANDIIPFPIYMFASKKQYDTLVGRTGTGGMYTKNDFLGSLAVLHHDKKKSKYADEGRLVLFHEYVHYFMRRNSDLVYPPWFSEGFAEFLSPFAKRENGKYLFAGLVPERVQWLNYKKNWMSFRKILNASTTNVRHGGEKASLLFYAQSWLLNHYLHTNPDIKDVERAAFIDALIWGTSPKEAIQEHLGFSLEDLDERMRILWANHNIPYMHLNLAGFKDKPVAVKTLSRVDKRRHAIEVSFAFFGSDEGKKKTHKRLKKAVKKYPDDLKFRILFARQLEGVGKLSESVKTLFAIDKKHHSDPLFRLAKGQLLAISEIRKDRSVAKVDPNKFDEAIPELLAGLETYENSSLGQKLIGMSYVYGTERQPRKALAHFIKAYAIRPEDKEIRTMYVRYQARFGDAMKACEVIMPFLVQGKHNQDTSNMKDVASSIEGRGIECNASLVKS